MLRFRYAYCASSNSLCTPGRPLSVFTSSKDAAQISKSHVGRTSTVSASPISRCIVFVFPRPSFRRGKANHNVTHQMVSIYCFLIVSRIVTLLVVISFCFFSSSTVFSRCLSKSFWQHWVEQNMVHSSKDSHYDSGDISAVRFVPIVPQYRLYSHLCAR